jgi:tetratricopeptide repeat protein/peptidase C39-like protein
LDRHWRSRRVDPGDRAELSVSPFTTERASASPWRLALFVFPLLLAACVTITPRSKTPSASAKLIPNMPMLKWGIESCGAGSLATILQHYGDPTSMKQWDASLPKTRGGVMTIDLLLAARQKGFEALLVTGTQTMIEDELRAGRPVILMLQVIDSPGHALDFFHYIVADGIDNERGLIRTQFGDGRSRWVSVERLEKPWRGGGHAAILIHPQTSNDQLKDALRAAIALEEEGKVAEAATRYREILASQPNSVVAWTDLGNAEMQLRRAAQAEEAFRKALALDSNSRDALNNLAWLLYQQKRLDEAEWLARRAVAQAGPDSYLVLDTLARVLAAKGSCDEALRTFQQAIDAVPSSRAQARAEIESGLAAARRTCSASS